MLEIQESLEALGITGSVSDSAFKIKFDVSPMQTKQIYALYVQKVNEIAEKQVAILTPAQKTLLAKPEAQAIIAAKKQEQSGQAEESKEETKEEPGDATCVIEILAVKKLETEEGESKTVACCVDFSYKDKSAKKLDVEK